MDSYTKSKVKQIEEAVKFGINPSLLSPIIDEIYEDGYMDCANEGIDYDKDI